MHNYYSLFIMASPEQDPNGYRYYYVTGHFMCKTVELSDEGRPSTAWRAAYCTVAVPREYPLVQVDWERDLRHQIPMDYLLTHLFILELSSLAEYLEITKMSRILVKPHCSLFERPLEKKRARESQRQVQLKKLRPRGNKRPRYDK